MKRGASEVMTVANDGTTTEEAIGTPTTEDLTTLADVAKLVGTGTVLEVIVVGTTGRREPEPMGVNSGISDPEDSAGIVEEGCTAGAVPVFRGTVREVIVVGTTGKRVPLGGTYSAIDDWPTSADDCVAVAVLKGTVREVMVVGTTGNREALTGVYSAIEEASAFVA